MNWRYRKVFSKHLDPRGCGINVIQAPHSVVWKIIAVSLRCRGKTGLRVCVCLLCCASAHVHACVCACVCTPPRVHLPSEW